MKCKNCGTENPNNAEYCKKCKKLLESRNLMGFPYEINLFSIIMGVILSSILLEVSYLVMDDGTVLLGLILLFVGGFITGILDKNILINSNDISAVINGGITGLIAGIIFAVSANLFSTFNFLIIFSLILYVTLGVAGGGIGGYITYLGKNSRGWKIVLFIVVILAISFAGYEINQVHIDGTYESAYGNQMVNLGLADIIQSEANADLNMKTNTSQQRKLALDKAKVKYDRMKYLAEGAKTQNKEMIDYSSSELKKEYAIALGTYIDIKYNFYNEMDMGINFSINGNEHEAEKHYKNAQKLVPEIKIQENELKIIAGKDVEFEKYIDQQDEFTKTAVERLKPQRMNYNVI